MVEDNILSSLFTVIEDEVDVAMICLHSNDELAAMYKNVQESMVREQSNGTFYEAEDYVDTSDICVYESDDSSPDGMEADEYIEAEQELADDEDDMLIDLVMNTVDEPS